VNPPRRPNLLLAHHSAELYGSDRMALESVRAFVAAGWDVVVVLPEPGPLLAELERSGARVVVRALPLLRKNLMSPRGALRYAVAVARALPGLVALVRRLRPDVLYVSTVTMPPWLLAGRLTRRRVLSHVHEAEEGLPRPVALALAAPLLLAHVVVANSAVTRDVVARAVPLLRRRTVVVHNGVPGPADGQWSPPPPRPGDPVRLVLVGRITPRKGTEVAVHALAHLRRGGTKAVLTLVGGSFAGNEAFEQELHDAVREHGLDDAVHWAGEVDTVWPSLEAADVVLVPSRVESFGNVAVEAMLACRPLVVASTQGLRETVLEIGAGEGVPAGDAAALADAVSRVLDDWDGAVARARRAREEAQRRFGPDRYAAGLVAVAESLRGSPGGS
jgi:hypothetical protein